MTFRFKGLKRKRAGGGRGGVMGEDKGKGVSESVLGGYVEVLAALINSIIP